jgi:hypothetical protein
MSDTDAELRAALIAAFPPEPITRATIHAPDARWEHYEERDDLARLEDRPWSELEPELLEKHGALLTHAGAVLYRAVLPAFLMFLAEHTVHTALPFHVAGQVTRKDSRVDQEIFDERVGPMSPEQRAAVLSA